MTADPVAMGAGARAGWPAFSISLEARAPEMNLWRRYQITAGSDLFGAWVIEARYGRIAAEGRVRRHLAADAGDARRRTRALLWRRARAPRRLDSVAYGLVAIDDPQGWARGIYPPPTLADLKAAWLAVQGGGRRAEAGWRRWFAGASLAGAVRGRLRLAVPQAAARRVLAGDHGAGLAEMATRLGLDGIVVVPPEDEAPVSSSRTEGDVR